MAGMVRGCLIYANTFIEALLLASKLLADYEVTNSVLSGLFSHILYRVGADCFSLISLSINRLVTF